MFSAEECRSRANECVRVAELTPDDPDASRGWRQLSEVWLSLAAQIDGRPPPAAPRSADTSQLVERPVTHRVATVKIGDALRDRLSLSNESELGRSEGSS